MNAPATISPLRLLLPFGFAYFMSYWFRSINAVIYPELVGELNLSASDLGLLSAAYLLAFSAFQIPLGVLLDRYGPRRVNAALVLCAASGALVFALSHSRPALMAARALIGLGVSGCLMSPIKAGSMWFTRERLPAFNGWIFFAGGIGALAATVPAEALLGVLHWRSVFVIAAALAAAAALSIFFTVPDHPDRAPAGDSPWQGLAQIFASRDFWRLASVTVFVQAAFIGIGSLWAGPWLSDVAGLSREAVALHLLSMNLASMLGAIAFGQLNAWLARRGAPPLRLFAIGVSGFVCVQASLALGLTGAPWLSWLLWGLFGTAGSLAFAIVPYYFAPHLAGRALTALNVLVFGMAFVVQWGIGVIINFWPQTQGHYHPDGYRAAFGVCVALQVVALAGFALRTRRARLASRT